MDPNSGRIFSGEVVDAMHRQSDRYPLDAPLKKMLKRLIPLKAKTAEQLSAMPLRDRRDWARGRNERKRASRARRGK